MRQAVLRAAISTAVKARRSAGIAENFIGVGNLTLFLSGLPQALGLITKSVRYTVLEPERRADVERMWIEDVDVIARRERGQHDVKAARRRAPG